MTVQNSGLIDVEHHFYPPKFLAERREALIKYSPGFPHVVEWTKSRSLEEMDRSGTAASIVSMGPPGLWLGDLEQSHRLTMVINEYGAEMVRDDPGRFGLLAALPLPDVDFSLKQIEYAYDVLKADGIGLMSNYDNRWPGHADFAPVFEELNRRKAVIFVHPTTARDVGDLLPEPAPPILEFLFDTTRAIASLLYSGTFARCPDIKWIFPHGGGTVPYLVDRFVMWANAKKNDPTLSARIPNGVEYELKRLYFDVVSVCNEVSMAALLKFVPTTQLMFGSDMPFVTISHGKRALDTVRPMMSETEFHEIEYGTAHRLFPRLRRHALSS